MLNGVAQKSFNQLSQFDFYQTIRNIGGWLSEDEGIFLYETARRVKQDHAIVEIGSWKGRSTVCLSHGSKDGSKVKVYAIDPHVGSSEHRRRFGKVSTFTIFQKNIREAGVTEHVKVLQTTSENAARYFTDEIGFCFIDGAHEYRLVMLDYRLWFDKLSNGGIIAFHDSWHHIGPHLATGLVLLTSSRIRKPQLVDTITAFEKVDRNSLPDRVENAAFVLYRTFFGVFGCIRLWRISRISEY